MDITFRFILWHQMSIGSPINVIGNSCIVRVHAVLRISLVFEVAKSINENDITSVCNWPPINKGLISEVSVRMSTPGGGGGVSKNESRSEWPETRFGFGIFEIRRNFVKWWKFLEVATSKQPINPTKETHKLTPQWADKSLCSLRRRD